MATNSRSSGVTPAQAQWIVERLIAERRISAADVRSLLSELGNEISDIERRLATLRASDGRALAISPVPRSDARVTKMGKRAERRKGHPRGIAGTLAVLLRSIPAAEHAAIAEIRADKGIKAAIKAAQAAMKRV